jgi:octaprenyl-diphosphate synthase
VIRLLAQGDGQARALVGAIVRDRVATIEQWRHLRTMLVQTRSIEYAYDAALGFVERAKQALRVFPPGSAREALLFLPDFVISRDR